MGRIVKIDGEKMHLKQGRYPSTAQNYLLLEKIIMTSDEQEEYNFPLALLSISLPDEQIEFDEIILNSNSDFRNLIIGLEKESIISAPIKTLSLGFTTVSVHKLIENG
jgi:hypothetical protein